MNEVEKISSTVAEVVNKILEEARKERNLQVQNQSKDIEQEQDRDREEVEHLIDKLQDKTQLIDYAKEYEHYTDADYEKDIEDEVEKYLNEEYELLSEDAMYHNNEELLESKLKEQENEIRNMVNKQVQERKNLVEKLPDLYKEQESLVKELQGKMQSLDKKDPVYQDAKQLLGQLEQTNELSNRENKSNEIDLEKEIDNHSKDLNNFIDNEVTNEKENITFLTKDELEGILNDHFKRVEATLHDYENKNIDADTFKNKLQSLTNHVKNNARSQFSKAKNVTVKPVKDLKNYAKNRINKFINSINDRLKKISASLDKKTNEQDKNYDKNTNVVQMDTKLTYKEKIENTLRNDPDLLKQAIALTKINAMRTHIQDSEKSLEQLNNLVKNNPTEQNKVNELRDQMKTHINEMKNDLNNIEKQYSPQKFNEQINEKVEQEQENEPTKTTEQEEVMER